MDSSVVNIENFEESRSEYINYCFKSKKKQFLIDLKKNILAPKVLYDILIIIKKNMLCYLRALHEKVQFKIQVRNSLEQSIKWVHSLLIFYKDLSNTT